jgi:hypothetical protein
MTAFEGRKERAREPGGVLLCCAGVLVLRVFSSQQPGGVLFSSFSFRSSPGLLI